MIQISSDTGIDAEVPARRPWWHLTLRILALMVVAAVVVAVLADKMPSPKSIWAALIKAHWWWVVAAFALQVASIGMLIRQQRRLLRAFGVPLPLSRVGAITYSSTAISMSLPAGSAVGAGYSFRQYRANGASAATAATVLLLSGIMSITGLVVLSLVGFGLAFSSRFLPLGQEHPVIAVLIGAAVLALIIGGIALLSRRHRKKLPTEPVATPRLDAWSEKHPKLGAAARQALVTGRQASQVKGRDWRFALLTSAANWALDCACLYAACRAFDIRIDLIQLGAIYLGIQLVRQIPLTPGGVGVIEASLLAALVAANAAEGPASAAVLVYRLFAAWLIVPTGFVMLALLRRTARHPADVPAPAVSVRLPEQRSDCPDPTPQPAQNFANRALRSPHEQ